LSFNPTSFKKKLNVLLARGTGYAQMENFNPKTCQRLKYSTCEVSSLKRLMYHPLIFCDKDRPW
jgi:hypothetical protein